MPFPSVLDRKEVTDMSNQNPEAFKERIATLINGWEEHAPNAKFFSLTLGEFKLQMNSSLKPREEIADYEAKVKAALVQRDNADLANRETVRDVVNAIRGDANYGENSPLYAALGYVPRNQRASGLSRSKAEETPTTAKAA
jgi:hypothetical protein